MDALQKRCKCSQTVFLNFSVDRILDNDAKQGTVTSNDLPQKEALVDGVYKKDRHYPYPPGYLHHLAATCLQTSGQPLIFPALWGLNNWQHYSAAAFRRGLYTPMSWLGPSLPMPLLPPVLASQRDSARRQHKSNVRRAVFSKSQRTRLERAFQQYKYISKPDRARLASKLRLQDMQIKIWFQNRRMKWRNSRERELLVHSRSRAKDRIPGCIGPAEWQQ